MVCPKDLKETLVQPHNSRCGICLVEFEPRYLQSDHRVPFEIAGDVMGEADPSELQELDDGSFEGSTPNLLLGITKRLRSCWRSTRRRNSQTSLRMLYAT